MSEKFNGDCAKCIDFIRHVKLFICMQPWRYPNATSKVELVSTLLISIASNWFLSLVKDNLPLLNDFEEFIANLFIAFGEPDRNMTTNSKKTSLCQGPRSSVDYAFEFKKSLHTDNFLMEMALIRQFQWGLRDEIKYLLLTMPEPSSLADAMNQVMKCDNKLRTQKQDIYSSNLILTLASISAFILPIKICGTKSIEGVALLDLGANTCFMDPSFVQQHSIALKPRLHTMRVDVGGGGATVSVTHETEPLELNIEDCSWKVVFNVMHNVKYPILLGQNWLEFSNPHIDWWNRKLKFPKIPNNKAFDDGLIVDTSTS